MSDRSLAELADINPPLAKLPRDSEAVSFVTMADVSESGNLTVHREQPFGRVKTGFTRFQDGDILFAKITPCMENGKGALVAGLEGGVGCGSTEFHVLRAKSGNDPRYLYQWLQWSATRQKAQLFLAGSAGQQRVPTEFFRRFRIPAPEAAIQGRIADVLSSLDDVIHATEALIDKHQQINAGLMRDLFTRGRLPDGTFRPGLSEPFKCYRDTQIGKVPLDWEVAGLLSRQRPGAKWIRTGPFGSSLKGEHWVTEGHPVITIGALGEGEFLSSELLYVGPRDASRLRDFQLCEGDVVFSRVADVGRSVVVGSENAGWIMSSNLMRIAVDPCRARPDFVQMALASDARIKSQIRAKVNSGGREVANSEILSQLLFAWPPPEEQERIVEVGLHAGSRIRSLRSTVQKLRSQKLGLMQDLLAGSLNVIPIAAAPESNHA